MPNREMDKIRRMHIKHNDEVTKFNNNYKKIKRGNGTFTEEIPISRAYSVIDTDLARDNIENDLTSADKQDL